MPRKVLIVEDENLIGMLLTIQFETLGYAVVVASDGEEGLAAVKKEMPDLVMLDLGLPKIDGGTLCGLIKSDAALKHMKVVLLTGKSLESETQNALNAGADLYVNKPYEWEHLRAQVQALLP